MKKNFLETLVNILLDKSGCFTLLNMRLLIAFSIVVLLINGCDNQRSTESGSEKKIENHVDKEFVSVNNKNHLIKEEEIPLSDYFKDTKTADSTFKALKFKRDMVFNLTSENPDSLGLTYAPEAVSIESIKIVGDFAYLSDPVHGNIKKICLKSGYMISSNPLENERFEFYLQEIAYFKSLLYVITHRNKIFRLTTDMEYVDSFFLPDSYQNNIYLYSDRGAALILFSDGRNDFIIDEKTRPSEYVVDEKTKIYQRRLHIDYQLNFLYDTLSFQNHSEYRKWITSIRGSLIKIEDKPFYLCNDKKYEVPKDFKAGRFFGGALGRNIDCSEQYLTFFDISLEEKKLYLYVYGYVNP
ncbi:MAG: hypothetical protein K0B37_16255 [Bacteroidales bacterium]|nr:hypothetical protein [Bacteroidales bacterium]